jgi:hypothetical protein
MADDTTQAHGQDRKRINTHQSHEVRDWSQKFGVTPEKLKKVVKKVGNSAQAVEKHLKGSSKPR